MNRFVVIEGGDGAGKSTQLRLLKEVLDKDGIDCVFTREPGGTEVSEKIRELILDPVHTNMSGLTELMLYAAARAQHIEQLIKPSLKAGKLVVCDRFTASTIAYQGYGRGLDLDAIGVLDRLAVGDCKPGLTLFLDVNPSEAHQRKRNRVDLDRMEQEGVEFHERVYAGYLAAEKLVEGFVKIESCDDKFQTHRNLVNALKVRGII